MSPKQGLWAFALWAFFLTLGCQSLQDNSLAELEEPIQWQYADLRILDPADAPAPEFDVVAVYLKDMGEELQLRLDWLDLQPNSICTVRIDFFRRSSIESLPSLTLSIQADGQMSLNLADGTPLKNARIMLRRDSQFDTWIINFSTVGLSWLRAGFWVGIDIFDPESGIRVEQVSKFKSNNPPPAPVPVLLAFWDLFDASTPALALRQWDGAHSGPERARHGLSHLFSAVDSTNSPLFLLDIRYPPYLSGLDYVGGIEQLLHLQRSGLAAIPEMAGKEYPVPEGASFGLSASSLVYLDAPLDQQLVESGSEIYFSRTGENLSEVASVAPVRCNGHIEINLPTSSARQATPDGPSPEVRHALANFSTNSGLVHHSGYAQYQDLFLFLGGSFKFSDWGVPESTSATLNYLASRPWIRLLQETELVGLRANPTEVCHDGNTISHTFPYDPLFNPQGDPLAVNAEELYTQIVIAISEAPGNDLKLAAEEMLAMLQDKEDPIHAALNINYLGQIGHLLAAAIWASNPKTTQSCDSDSDWDGQVECIYATETLFTIVELDGGYISVGAIMLDGEPHQFIAPTWQFMTGLSDPQMWKMEQGIFADPSALPGAFYENTNDHPRWQARFSSDGLIVDDGEKQKAITLSDNRLRVQYSPESGSQTLVSLGLDGWRRFNPSWAELYLETTTSDQWRWALSGGPEIILTSTSPFGTATFNQSREFVNNPEDPNFAYPEGHYLPFPMAIVGIQQASSTELIITSTQK